jgi:tRNA G10  N-methylase Trm11
MTDQASKSTSALPALPKDFVYRLDLSRAATSRLLQKRAVHRWFGFPQSYSPELVEAILEEWCLLPGSIILDPFVGAGTTMRVAQERGYSALGTDLSPLAVLVSRVKVRTYDQESLKTALSDLQKRWGQSKKQREIPPDWVTSERLQLAFTPLELIVLAGLRDEILALQEAKLRDLFLVALLSILPNFSRAVANGGWFRWVERPDQSERIASRLWEKTQDLVRDLEYAQKQTANQDHSTWEVRLLDARLLNTLTPKLFDALITSPPYANRHDYSRVFQIELLTLGKCEDDIFALRHNSLRSHVEARPPGKELRLPLAHYEPSALLLRCFEDLPENTDKRVRQMMLGYFEDMFLVLRAARAVLKPGARIALVVGNVRHSGVLFPVDEILAEIGQLVGYQVHESWVIRLRGNSAQQMGKFGRVPARETVVMLQTP